MRVSGFTIARDTVRFGYPLDASLRSMLPLVDELVVNVGQCDDGTWELVQSIGDPKIKAFRAVWEPRSQRSGRVLAEQTNAALERCTGDWGLYLQADEVLHERDHAAIRHAMMRHLRRRTEALMFRHLHFYGSFQTVQDHPWRWYGGAIRAVKLGIGAVSRGDAMDFGLARNGVSGHLSAVWSGATVYHYGWCRPPEVMLDKQRNLEQFYQNDEWIARRFNHVRPADIFSDRGHLRRFHGAHPRVMQAAAAVQSWTFEDGIAQQPPEWLRRPYAWGVRRWRRLAAVANGRANAQQAWMNPLGGVTRAE